VTYWHPLRNAVGEIVGINVAAEEVTERKRAEAALHASERELRSARDAAEAALRNLQETQNFLIEAEKLAALGRLVAGVAHEINSPVGTSLTVASSLERKTAVIADDLAHGNLRRSALNEFLKISHAASSQLVANLNHAAEMIQSFKQVATDRSYSNQRAFDLGDLTEQVIRSLRPGLADQRVSLRVDCQSGLTMDSYPGPYGQVLTNLFLNSVTHAFPDATEGTVSVKVRASGDGNVEVLFADTGCGMSLDVRRKAFDPFFTTRRDQGCTGLGLHIVYTIVTNCLGGRVNLHSEPGEGTKIRIILPRMAPKAKPPS
jgi:signal transduction histidine kinase